MQVERHADAAAFLARAQPFLEAREAEHNLMLGLCTTLLRDRHAFGPADPYLATVDEGGRLVAAALRTPPYNLVVSESDDARACAALCADVAEVAVELGGVLGPAGSLAAFREAWQRRTGASARRTRHMGIYRAASVTMPENVPGSLRPYASGDRSLALAWLGAFFAEVMPDARVETPESTLAHRLADPDGGFVLWEDDGAAVSLAGFGSPTPHGIRVGPVYTPPELRGRGYASAVTAALTSSLLDRGRRFCFLFTDLANPTSNSIYRRIGYRPVTDVEEWRFES